MKNTNNLTFKVDNRSKTPPAEQIAYMIKDYISQRNIDNDEIKTHEIFSNKYQVDIKDVKEAFIMLLNDGVFKIDDSGNYYNVYERVADFSQGMDTVIGFIKDLKMEPTVKLVKETKILVNKQLASIIGFNLKETMI